VKSAAEYEAKERATRLLTAKLRIERLAREATGASVAKAEANRQNRNQRLLLALSGHRIGVAQCPLLGVKRTLVLRRSMLLMTQSGDSGLQFLTRRPAAKC
jgi:hypothetical protein